MQRAILAGCRLRGVVMRENVTAGLKAEVSSPQDNEYYRRRAAAELELAGKATHTIAAKVHSELALMYAARSVSLDMGEESRWQGFMLNGCR